MPEAGHYGYKKTDGICDGVFGGEVRPAPSLSPRFLPFPPLPDLPRAARGQVPRPAETPLCRGCLRAWHIRAVPAMTWPCGRRRGASRV